MRDISILEAADAKLAQAGIKQAKLDLPVLEKVFDALQEGTPARALDLSEEDLEVLKELNLITLKPVLYVLNVAEDDIADPEANPYVQKAAAQAEKEGAKWGPISAEIEQSRYHCGSCQRPSVLSSLRGPSRNDIHLFCVGC